MFDIKELKKTIIWLYDQWIYSISPAYIFFSYIKSIFKEEHIFD